MGAALVALSQTDLSQALIENIGALPSDVPSPSKGASPTALEPQPVQTHGAFTISYAGVALPAFFSAAQRFLAEADDP